MNHRVASAYAQALLDLAAESGSVDAVGEELTTVARALAADREVAGFLTSRLTGAGAKKRVVDHALTGKVDERVRALALLLAGRARLGLLGEITEEYGRRAEKARGIQHVKVTSAAELGEGERERIVRELTARLGRTVLLETAVDPALMAGMRVETEGMEYDLSVDGLLRGLASHLGTRR